MVGRAGLKVVEDCGEALAAEGGFWRVRVSGRSSNAGGGWMGFRGERCCKWIRVREQRLQPPGKRGYGRTEYTPGCLV